MKLKKSSLAIAMTATCLFLGSTAVMAQTFTDNLSSGWYVAGKIGASFQKLDNQNLNANVASAGHFSADTTYNIDNNVKTRFTGGVAVGYDFYPQYQFPVRLEANYMISSNAKTSVNDSALGEILGASGDSSLIYNNKLGLQTFMLMGYVDWHNSSAFTPYIGVGVGLAHAKVRADGKVVNDSTGDVDYAGDASTNNNRFALANTVGMNYAITDNLSADLSYTYSYIGKLHTSNYMCDDSGQRTNTFVEASSRVATHNVLLGLRYAF